MFLFGGGNLDALWFEVLLFVSVLDASVLKKDMPTAPPKKVQFLFRPKGSQSHRRLREGRSVGGSMATKDSRDGGGW